MGRPTKYNEEMLEKAKLYLEDHIQQDDEVPSIEGLSYYLDASKNTLYAWAEDHPEFLNTLERVKAKQARMLISGGLTGSYNSTITKLMLYNHGFSEKQEIDHTVQGQLIINRAGKPTS